MYDSETTYFDQKRFLYLFDETLKFSLRDDFDADKHDLLATDYAKMRKINRNVIYEFLRGLKGNEDAGRVLASDLSFIPINMLNKEGSICDMTIYHCMTKLL